MQPARPLYFPVSPLPLRMQAGLQRFGTDFGNAEVDRSFFPRDALTPDYVAEKARILAAHPGRSTSDVRSPSDAASVEAARRWMLTTLSTEGYGDLSPLSLEGLALRLSDDFAVLHSPPDGRERVVSVHVCFPSGWRPEHILGKSFTDIHALVPAFDAVARKAVSLVEAMVTRGPYVRFVWTISADAELDHHPDQGKRSEWSPSTERGYLRVERQTTVPLPDASASVFLIRTYLYAFDELTSAQRSILSDALRQMPAEIARYKRIDAGLPRALELLR